MFKSDPAHFASFILKFVSLLAFEAEPEFEAEAGIEADEEDDTTNGGTFGPSPFSVEAEPEADDGDEEGDDQDEEAENGN